METQENKQSVNRIERALENQRKGYNCAQAVFCAYCDHFGLDEENGYRIAEALGGGIGGVRDGVCGALSAVYLLAGMSSGGSPAKPGATKPHTYEQVQALRAAFYEKNHSIVCRDLLGLDDPATKHPQDCVGCVRDAAELAERLLAKQEND